MLKIKFNYDIGMMGHSMYVYYENGKNKVFLVDGGSKERTVVYGEAVDSSEIMFGRIEDLSALALAIKEMNVQLPDESFTKGKLQATEKHLEDMRALVPKLRIKEQDND